MRNARPRAWRLFAVLLALGLVAAACGDDGGSGGGESSDTSLETGTQGEDEATQEMAPEYGGSVTIGLEADTNNWTPGPAQWANSGFTVAFSFYDPLISLDEAGEFTPFLAESLEPNEDLTEWTMTLRDGVQYHDGTPLDADSILWNFNTLHNTPDSQSYGTLQTAGVTGMEKVDDMTVVYTLSEPNAAFPDLLRGEIGVPVSQTAYEADPEGFTEKPVGTGPFVFESWTRDSELKVTRNENYWMTDADGNQLPYLDGITFRPIPDDAARSASLESDDIQMMQTLRGPSVKKIQSLVDEGGYASSFFVGNTSSVSLLNTLVPPLDDVRIRQALAYANDSEAMAEIRDDNGLVPPATGFFSQDSPWYSAEADSSYPGFEGQNLEEATALVEEYKNDASRSDGKAPGEAVTLDYECQPDASLVQGAQLLQSIWQSIGIETNLNQIEQADMITGVVGSSDTEPPFAGDFTVACWRAGGGDGDPLTAFQSFFGEVASTPGNFANFTDPEISTAIETLRTTADFAERYSAVETISSISAENVPVVWNIGTPTAVGYRSDIHGVADWTFPDGEPGNGTPGATVRWHQVWMEQ